MSVVHRALNGRLLEQPYLLPHWVDQRTPTILRRALSRVARTRRSLSPGVRQFAAQAAEMGAGVPLTESLDHQDGTNRWR